MQRNVFLSAAFLYLAVMGASVNAQQKSVEELKKAGDLRGLVAKLGDRRAAVRREAAVALPGVLEKVKDPAALNPIIGRLFDVRFRDPWKSTREYSGRALMNALNKDQRPSGAQQRVTAFTRRLGPEAKSIWIAAATPRLLYRLW